MKIAIISSIDQSWGGSEELWYRMALYALKEGHIIHASMRYTGTLSPKTIEMINKGLILHKRRGYIPRGTKTWKRITKKMVFFLVNKFDNPYRRLFKSKPDVVIYNSSLYQPGEDDYFQQMVGRFKTPYIIINNIVAEFFRPFVSEKMRTVYPNAVKVFFVAEGNKQILERHLAIKLDNAEIITTPVNLADTSIVAYPTVDDEEIIFASIGNLFTNHKGQDILLATLAGDIWKKRKWKLKIYGKGPDEEYLKILCSNYNLGNRIEFCGYESNLREIWKNAHALLMCSIMEGTPLSVVEAMLCGRIVIATDVGGNREIIDDGITGFVAEAPTKYSFNKALERAWSCKYQWESMGKTAHNKISSYFNPDIGENFLKKVVNLKELLDENI